MKSIVINSMKDVLGESWNRKISVFIWSRLSVVSTILFFCMCTKGISQSLSTDISQLKPGRTTGFSNGGWMYDRYPELESLDAGKSIVVADLKGPGIITHIHTTRHKPKELFTRGIVIEIWFDNVEEPAVLCPLGDFFGDGCNGNSMDFSSIFIECAPWSYNCYFPMPFKSRARVILRNDTERNAMNYSYVEWESLPEWNTELGYFHATYARKSFQLTKDTRETFFETDGLGHIIGRQFSVVTDEYYFRGFHTVMEGNNEVDIDGYVRKMDYLGSEDSFTFSWGFNQTFAGLRAGMPFIEKGTSSDTTLSQLSIYRFHDHMPIRFNKSVRWTIDWSHETAFIKSKVWPQKVDAGGCWVDYATVFYWYSDKPGSYKHYPFPPIKDRSMILLHSSKINENQSN